MVLIISIDSYQNIKVSIDYYYYSIRNIFNYKIFKNQFIHLVQNWVENYLIILSVFLLKLKKIFKDLYSCNLNLRSRIIDTVYPLRQLKI